MISYASKTGTLRNLAAMRASGWRILISRLKDNPGGFQYALDNGAWSDFQAGRPFDEDRFDRLLDKFGGGADWVVLPDIVAGGIDSLNLSKRWMNRCLSIVPKVLIAVQNGMEHEDLAPLVGPNVGVFLGGDTEWKLDRMADWGQFCASRGVYYHVARVNTAKRIKMAAAAGADSIDGSSGSRFAKTIPLIDNVRRQPDFFNPRSFHADF